MTPQGEQAQGSNFDFLEGRWEQVLAEASTAERYTLGDPRTGLVYTRRALEALVDWMYRADQALVLPLQDSLNNRMTAPEFVRTVQAPVRDLMHAIRKATNNAVHGTSTVAGPTALKNLVDLWQIALWFARRYAASEAQRPVIGLRFDPDHLKQYTAEPQLTAPERAKLQEDLAAKDAALAAERERAADYERRIAELQAQVAAQTAANQKIPDTVDYTEAATREFIDLYLREAGWDPAGPNVREFELNTIPTADGSNAGHGFADYVLWGKNGLPLAVLEAKRASKDAHAGQQQAKLYADGLEARFGQRPVIYFSNGYRHWIWDDTRSPEREVLGFHTQDELQLMVDRRTDRKRLSSQPLPEGIADRPYQQKAIRAVAEAFDGEKPRRRALLVMATGTGKTRTVIALSKLLQDARWVKRILFLADRTALVTQAARAFGTVLENSSPAVVGQSKPEDLAASRLHLATYPAIMNVIDASSEGRLSGPDWRGVGYYDLIVVDEAHRSIYLKYKQIFDYFDALVVGLTATPHAEIDRNTYSLFGIEDNNPTSGYELNEAVADGYLVPPRVLEVGTRFTREGARYDELSEADKEEWDQKEWDDDGEIPEEVAAPELNKWLFNEATVDHVIKTLMERGDHVAGGNLIGKTIIFARNQDHADFIHERINHHYPQYNGHLSSVITYRSSRSQSLIDAFSKPYEGNKKPTTAQIAISVDMLDTGIDVPDVVNLVFFKPVFSKAKFWQMVGRGTRLRPGLYGPGQDKTHFLILDVMGNVEFFNAGLDAAGAALPKSLAERTFATRLGLLEAAEQRMPDDAFTSELAAHLARQVSEWPEANFAVRPHIEAVRSFGTPGAWRGLDLEAAGRARADLAPLAALSSGEGAEESQRFDLLALQAQLASLTGDSAAAAAAGKRLVQLARALQDQANIPVIQAKLPLINSVVEADASEEEEWVDADPRWLERVRKGLRELVPLIERKRRKVVYANFADEAQETTEAELVGVTESAFDLSYYRERVRLFLESQLEKSFALRRLRSAKALTPDDLAELERLLLESGAGSPEDLARAAEGGLELFIRSLVGLDQAAVMEELSGFMAGSTLTSRQLSYLEQVARMLAKGGAVDAGALWDPPFSDAYPGGPTDLFPEDKVTYLFEVVNRIGGKRAS
ncbi:DUF4145 domain-containing protein [Galactobacter valiniphilus]|uniref:DUF4145 domain-containing protein n=1 Tax=Galactobacter valiniphilus TaxID=2676122 RepID=A0A399JHB2_9MICC|nr:DEAD/DEAH box helicase family protein [Galactobacter valiniphilus]RII43619.1 DUF4145 domain-containing protein [Galactobacter valiniphilus]